MTKKTTDSEKVWYDCTKSAKASHRSGLQRVAQKVLEELGAAATPTQGLEWVKHARATDWFLTAEVFSPVERPGFAEILESRPCPMAAIFYDAIPLKQPHITWPASVARHPAYMKMLVRFDLVLAISEASRRELLDYWAWMGLERVPRVESPKGLRGLRYSSAWGLSSRARIKRFYSMYASRCGTRRVVYLASRSLATRRWARSLSFMWWAG